MNQQEIENIRRSSGKDQVDLLVDLVVKLAERVHMLETQVVTKVEPAKPIRGK